MNRAVGLSFGPIREGKTLLPSTSLSVMGEVAGVKTALLGGYLHSTKTRVPETQRPRVQPGEGWAPPGCTLPKTHHVMITYNHTIPDWLPPGSTRTATFCRTPGRRCQVCYWCIIEDSRKRQHHHRHLEHKDTKSRRETSGTNTKWTGTDGTSLDSVK